MPSTTKNEMIPSSGESKMAEAAPNQIAVGMATTTRAATG